MMTTKKTAAKKIEAKMVTAKPLTPFIANAELVAARQDVNLVRAAGIVNGMSQEECDARLMQVLGAAKKASATDTSGNVAG